MGTLPVGPEAARLASEAQEYWRARALPLAYDPSRPAPAGTVTLFLDPLPATGPLPYPTAAALVLADVAARYLMLTGRSIRDPVFLAPGDPTPRLDVELDSLALWFGRKGRQPLRSAERVERLHRMMASLAAQGLLVRRTLPYRACPGCRRPVTPETFAYRDEARPVLLVRFPLLGFDGAVSALVWTDAAWKLLGAEAIVLHPDRPYVRVEFRRRGSSEQLLLAKAALPKLAEWMPRGELTVLEERPGSEWAGARFAHPLWAEAPALAGLAPPSGTLLPSGAVEERGSGIVAVAPAHGPADGRVARELKLAARSVVDAAGRIEATPASSYAGMELATAESCLRRDLVESGRLFSEPRERCGVPRCLRCGSELYWRTGGMWCLDLAKVPDAVRERFDRLLPGEPFPTPSADVVWPVSAATDSSAATSPLLAEGSACGRVFPAPGPELCPCGVERPTAVRRELLPGFEDPLLTAAGLAPMPLGGPLWIVLPQRRRAAALLHRLVAIHAAEHKVGDLRSILLHHPPDGLGAAAPIDGSFDDARRAALVRTGSADRSRWAEALQEESSRVRRIWQDTQGFLAAMAGAGYTFDTQPVTTYLHDLLPEDRSLLTAFERMRRDVLNLYDQGRYADGYARVARFYDGRYRSGYLHLAAARLGPGAPAAERVALFHVLCHVTARIIELFAPVLPESTEAIHRAFFGDGASLFQGRIPPVVQGLLEESSEPAIDRWTEIARELRGARRRLRLPAGRPVPQVVLSLASEEEAERLRPHTDVGARLLETDRLTVASPKSPWAGFELAARPREEVIRKSFPAYHRKILSILGQMDARRLREALRSDAFQVAIEGQTSIRIPATMVDVVETLPAGFAAFPVRGAELLIELPGKPGSGENRLPPDAARIQRHVARRLRQTGGALPVPAALEIWADEAGRADVGRHSADLARALGFATVAVAATPEGFLPEETSNGRLGGKRGFKAWIPGVAAPRRRRSAPRRSPTSELVLIAAPVTAEADSGAPASDPADALIARWDGVHGLADELGEADGLPSVGVTKLAGLWDAGLRSRSDLAAVDLDRLSHLPGMGPFVARELLRAVAPERALPDPPPLYVATAEPEAALPIPNETETLPAVTNDLPIPPATAVPPRRPADRPRASAVPAPVARRSGGLEIVTGATRDVAWDAFLAALESGRTGLWVGRLFPRALRTTGADRDVRFLWMSTSDRPNSVRPTDLDALLGQLTSSLREGHVQFVLVEEVEYLAALNGVPAVRDLLQRLDTVARETGARIWVPVDPGLVPGDASPLVDAVTANA